MNTSELPLIFVASGQDQIGQGYGYNLKLEQRALQSALAPAEQAGLCQVVSETNLCLDVLIEAFSTNAHRLAVLFLGGTSDDYTQLLAAKATRPHLDQSGEDLYEGDLPAFLASQKALQLVFLNGCGSEAHAEQLLQAGVPLVISSTQAVVDGAATELSARFFKGLAQGAGLRRAWEEAINQVKISKGEGKTSSYQVLEQGTQVQAINTFPWKLWVKSGAELVENWNLPIASQNPLLKLPLPKKWLDQLPAEPYLGLHYFQRSDAGIFFGRGRQIWELYQRITGPSPVILYYGKSGAGKSSLLDAGLLPRIEEEYTEVYMRRIQALGLEGSLFQALLQKAESLGVEVGDHAAWQRQRSQMGELNLAVHDSDARVRQALKQEMNKWKSASSAQARITELWKAIESKTGLPLLLILDQLEEAFTRPVPPESGVQDELNEFLSAIHPLFSQTSERPRGKLLLSYRKEYHPEIREACYEWKLPCSELFLQHLDRAGIIEAVEGVSKQEATSKKYGLEFAAEEEGKLGEIIADDLLEDSESPVAAVLQIVLTKLWNSAKATNANAPVFSIQQYQRIKKEGLAMGEFFQKQLLELQKWQAEVKKDVVDSGLVLDVLQFHTTQQGTSGIRKLEELRENYQHRQDVIDQLIAKCKELYLLTETQNSNQETSLSHDTLAPVVLQAFNESDTPGQRAARILNNKLGDFEADKQGVYLDESDLLVVEKGLLGMKKLREKSNELLAWSRVQRSKREKERKRNRRIMQALGLGLVIFGVVAGLFWAAAQRAQDNTIRTQIRASWKAGEFLRVAEEADYETSRSWLEGVRQMEKFLRPIVDLEKINSLSPVPVFLSGPHEKEFNFKSSSFGYYNPEFVTWAREYGIPASEDETFRDLTQSIYDDFLQIIAQSYYYTYLKMEETVSQERMEEVKAEYLRQVQALEGQNFTAGFGNGPGEYLQYKVAEFGQISQEMFNIYSYPDPRELIGYHGSVATGFWTRREIDGSKDEIVLLLEQLLNTYDADFLANPVFQP